MIESSLGRLSDTTRTRFFRKTAFQRTTVSMPRVLRSEENLLTGSDLAISFIELEARKASVSLYEERSKDIFPFENLPVA
jgi:hypothetical protein